MITPLLVDNQHANGMTQALRQPTRASGRRASNRSINVHLETPTEAIDALSARTPADALTWLTQYLRRRDRVLAELAAEEFGSVLDTLATEFRKEAAAEPTSPHTTGLTVAAAVVSDTAAAFASLERTLS